MPKLTAVEQHIVDAGNVRWAYPNGYFYWFVGGATQDAGVQDRMRYRLTRDMTTIQASCRRKRVAPVALLSDTQIDSQFVRAIRAMPGWKTIVFGGAKGFQLPNNDQICAATADLIVCYGDPSDALHEIVDQLEKPPALIRRNMRNAEKVRMPVRTTKSNPNGRFWTDVDRLTHVRPNPLPGLRIRDEIDLRPQYHL